MSGPPKTVQRYQRIIIEYDKLPVKPSNYIALGFLLLFFVGIFVFMFRCEPDKETVGGIEFIRVPAGEFMQGRPDGSGESDEHPQHRVSLSAFYMSRTEITQRQYRTIMGKNPSNNQGDDHPVENVNWRDAMEFVIKFSKKFDVQARLPHEAEWEYACKAGSDTSYFWGNAMDGSYCWYEANADRKTRPVGLKLPNAWVLYDMVGNVWEWCWDWYDSDYYSKNADDNPDGPYYGQLKVIRGGSKGSPGSMLYSSYRNCLEPEKKNDHLGFRIVIK